MGEAKWVKFLVGMFDDPKLKIINSMEEDRDIICYVWVRCIMLAGVCNQEGLLSINEYMPYTLEILSIEFNRPIDAITKAFEVLMSFRMIEKTDDGIYKVINFEKHQNMKALNKLREENSARVAKCRAKKKAEKKGKNDINKSKSDEGEMQNNQCNEENNECNKENNVTCNDGNANVMVQKKREKKREEKKIKNKETERDCNNNNNNNNNLDGEVYKLTQYFRDKFKNKKDRRCINTAAIKSTLLKHNAEYVKLAIDKSLLAGKPRMSYVNGILENWMNEGYPILSEGEDRNGGRVFTENSKNNTTEYGDIQKKKPRKITDDELRYAESKLI